MLITNISPLLSASSQSKYKVDGLSDTIESPWIWWVCQVCHNRSTQCGCTLSITKQSVGSSERDYSFSWNQQTSMVGENAFLNSFTQFQLLCPGSRNTTEWIHLTFLAYHQNTFRLIESQVVRMYPPLNGWLTSWIASNLQEDFLKGDINLNGNWFYSNSTFSHIIQ